MTQLEFGACQDRMSALRRSRLSSTLVTMKWLGSSCTDSPKPMNRDPSVARVAHENSLSPFPGFPAKATFRHDYVSTCRETTDSYIEQTVWRCLPLLLVEHLSQDARQLCRRAWLEHQIAHVDRPAGVHSDGPMVPLQPLSEMRIGLALLLRTAWSRATRSTPPCAAGQPSVRRLRRL